MENADDKVLDLSTIKNLRVRALDNKDFYLVTPEAKRHLLNSLSSLERGQAPTPSFKLYGKTDASVATDFIRSVQGKPDLPEWLIPYELSRLEKFGPQGGHAPWSELRENASMYFSRPTSISDKLLRQYYPYLNTVNKYSSMNLCMLGIDETLITLVSDDKIKDRASGWPTFNLKKTDHVAQTKAKALLRSNQVQYGYGYFFSRFNKQKKRLFIPMPFCSMLDQARYFNPFLKYIQKDLRANKSASPFAFWADKIGFGPCFEEIMGGQLRAAKVRPDHLVYVMRDFEKMDTTMGPSQKEHFFLNKLAKAFHFKMHSTNYEDMKRAMLFSNYCNIATPEGMWSPGKEGHGEGSGSTVTNGGETCANEDYDALFQYILRDLCKKANISYRLICTQGNGDDGESIYELDDMKQFEEFQDLIRKAAELAATICGFRIQADKWDIIIGHGKYCQYLNYFDGSKMNWMYPAVLILNSIMNPEKQYTPAKWDKDYRDLDIIEKLDNGRNLPYFHELVDYVDNGMKYHLLGTSEEETRRILSKFERYRALQDGSRDFNIVDYELEQDISKSPTVLYLLSKRHLSLQ